MRFTALTMVAMVVIVGAVAWIVLRDASTAGGLRPAPAATAARAVARPEIEDAPPATETSSAPSDAAPSREPAPVEQAEDEEAGETELFLGTDGEVIRTDASVGRGGILVDGSVVVLDADGRQAPASSGSFSACPWWRGEKGQPIERVPIREGRFRFRLVAGASRRVDIGVVTLDPDGRIAVPEKYVHDVVDDSPLVLRARLASPVRLEVVDARSGESLRDVTVVELHDRRGTFERRYRPGEEILDGIRIASDAESPVEVKPSHDRYPDRIEWRPRLFVSASGHAWAKVDADFRRGGTIRVELEAGADLDVTTLAPEDEQWVWSQLPPRIRIYRPQSGASAPDAEQLVDERMRRFAAMDDAELQSATPDGRLPTAAELRREVSIDLDRLRRAALWGPLVAESVANVDEPTRVRGLDPGRYIVTLQRGETSRHPQVFAETTVDLAPGANAVTLAVPEQEEVEKVRLAGTLRFSTAWGERSLELDFDPVCVAGATENDERRLMVGDLERVEGSSDLFRFEIDDLRPGRYLVKAGRRDWRQVVDTGPHGCDDVKLEIGDPADLLIHLVDDESGGAVDLPESVGGRSSGYVVGIRDLDWDFAWDRRAGALRLRVPAGELHLAWSSLVGDRFEVVDPGRITVHPGANELTLRVRRLTSIEIAFDGEGEPIESLQETLKIEVKSLDVRGQGLWQPFRGEPRLSIRVPGAGRYLVTLPPIPGCADVPPFEVTAQAGEAVTRTVHLLPRR